MKKYFLVGLIFFIIGGIICSSITAYATLMYQANQIAYTKSNNQEITLDTALNELYSAAGTETYTPSGHITPTTSEQELQTSGKKVTSNIIIDPIPSGYKDVSNSTVSSASDILTGKTAYLSNGTKVTGTRKECVHSSFTCNSSCANGTYNFLDFNPSFFIVTLYGGSTRAGHMYYSEGGFMTFEAPSGASTGNGSIYYRGSTYKYYTINTNSVTINALGSGWLNKTVYYTACK